MESKIRKSSIYGFLFGLAIAILFVDYKEVIDLGNGGYETRYKPLIDYIVTILRCGIVGMFLGLFYGWKRVESKSKTKEGKSYYLLFFFVVFIVSMSLMAVFNW